jgi:hypothetical protein
MLSLAIVLGALVLGGAALVGCEEDSPNCPNGPYQFDSNVQRCRDADGQFAVNECC